MTFLVILLLSLSGVTPSPGWSYPVLLTDSCNTQRPVQFLHRDNQERFHLIWGGMNDENRIGYKIFSLDGTTLYPETMISRNTTSAYLSTMITGDSLYAFWREYSPIYYSVRSLSDGSEIVPATYLFTTSTLYPYIRACPDSLGRLHVLFNRGSDVIYAVWTPVPGSGFITEREWKIDGASAGGVLLVDGNRVHIVVQDPDFHDYCYLQYDMDGNTVVLLIDFTPGGNLECSRFPELGLDSSGNLMVVEHIYTDCWNYALWKLDKNNGLTLIDQKAIVNESPPEMYIGAEHILRSLPGTDLFYLAWTDNGLDHHIWFLLMDSNGDVLVDWALAYDYADEDPENLPKIDGVVDSEGNLYLAYEQGETEPVLGYFPTFGWFNHDFVGVQQQEAVVIEQTPSLTISSNPVSGSVTVYTGTSASQTLRIFDLYGREVSSITVTDGTGIWNGDDFTGKRLPAGIYTITGDNGLLQRLVLIGK